MNKKNILVLIVCFIVQHANANSIANVINKRGFYKYSADFIAQPTDPSDAIIKIQSSHVVLDLQGYCMVQDSSNTVTGLTGIEIGPNVEDVIIKNGSVLQLSGFGVKVLDGSNAVQIENFIIDGCQAGGIFIDGLVSGTGVEKFLLKNSLIFSCTGAQGSPALGVHIKGAHNVRVENCSFLENDALTTSSGYGCFIEQCSTGKIIDCTMQNMGGNELVAGCYVLSSTNIFLDNCFAMHNRAYSTASNAFSAGFYIQYSDNIICNDCQSLQNNSAQSAFGFNVESGTGNIFRNCIAESNSGATGAAGFQFTTQSSSVIEDCLSNLNNTTSSGMAYGIHLFGSANDHCYIAHNNLVGNNGVSASRGIEDDAASSTSFFQKNNCFNNGTNYAVSYPASITLPLVIGSLSSASPGLPTLQAGELENVDVNP
ncbi:MAG: right-handed parallel beta-helix repeat-containing protein [Candidatus Babeliales bacterium]